MNDFGGTLGGPLRIPRLASSQNPSFFFASYEGLRLPRETPIVLSVPTNDMRNGNLTGYLARQGIAAICRPSSTTHKAGAHPAAPALSPTPPTCRFRRSLPTCSST